jgi:hypothetical protein
VRGKRAQGETKRLFLHEGLRAQLLELCNEHVTWAVIVAVRRSVGRGGTGVVLGAEDDCIPKRRARGLRGGVGGGIESEYDA